MGKRVRVLGTVLVLALGRPQVASAHPIHMSFTEIRLPAKAAATIEISVRVYANDFSAAAARHTRTRLGGDSTISAEKGYAYLMSTFRVIDRKAARLPLTGCGVTRMGDMLRFCLRANVSAGGAPVRVANSIMTELFPDQVNVVQSLNGGRRSSRMFLRGDGWKVVQ
jgi:hypothetical protein